MDHVSDNRRTLLESSSLWLVLNKSVDKVNEDEK